MAIQQGVRQKNAVKMLEEPPVGAGKGEKGWEWEEGCAPAAVAHDKFLSIEALLLMPAGRQIIRNGSPNRECFALIHAYCTVQSSDIKTATSRLRYRHGNHAIGIRAVHNRLVNRAEADHNLPLPAMDAGKRRRVRSPRVCPVKAVGKRHCAVNIVASAYGDIRAIAEFHNAGVMGAGVRVVVAVPALYAPLTAVIQPCDWRMLDNTLIPL